MSHNRDLSAAAGQFGFHSSNIGIGSEAPRYALDVYNSNLLVSGPSAGNIILEDRGVGDSSRPFHVVSSDGGKFVINRSNRNASGTTTSSVNSLTLSSSGNLGLGPQTSPASNIHIADLSANGYELKITGNALQFNRSSNSYIDQLHDTGSILFRMTSSNTEAMRITSAGRMGVGCTPETDFQVRNGNGGTVKIGGSGTSATGLEFQYSNSGNTTSVIKTNYRSTSSAASLKIDTGTFLVATGTNGAERLRIDGSGTLLINAAIDNTGGHGQIVAHAPTSGNTIYKAIEIGNTDGDGTARGAAICGQPRSNSHLPYTLIGSWDHGDNTDVYYGGGWGGAMRPATRHRFYTNSSYPTSGGSGTEVVRITESGDLGVNVTSPLSKLHVNLTKSSGTTAAERTKQHAAMRLSLDRTSGHMPYTGWGPALDFYSDNYDGSAQRPNARIAGVISNYSAGHEGGELRFYTTPTDTASSESDYVQNMTITSAGYVMKPNQPAFFVYQAQGPWSLAAGDTFTFNTAELNVGSHYSTSNGRFTAPITGRYVFHFWSIYTGNAGNDYVQMYKNGARIYGGDVHFTNSVGSQWDSVHYSRLIQLSAGDYVYMRSGSAHQYHGNHWGGWSGYLLG